MSLVAELESVVDLLHEAGVEYALCGGLAVAVHGYERFTKDIDLLVLADDAPRITALVRQLGFSLSTGPMPFGVGTGEEREVHRISKLLEHGPLPLDLVVVGPALQGVWETRQQRRWRGRHLTVISADGLATMKRLAGRPQDLLDLERLGFPPDEEGS